MKKAFLKDLQKVYDELKVRQEELNSFYTLIDKEHPKAQELVDAFLQLLKLPKNSDTTMAALTRMVSLREDALEQVLQKMELSADEIAHKKELSYGFVSTLHITRHERLIEWIEHKKLLTPFYRGLIFGVHIVGVRVSQWQSRWTNHIIHDINRELHDRFDGDDSEVMKYLESHDLLDRDSSGDIADRCYSILLRDGDGYRAVPYSEGFAKETADVVEALDRAISIIGSYEDEVYGQHAEWLIYFQSIRDAFACGEIEQLVVKWSEVDRAWMSIKTPIQVGHPLEYYEDHYRKAVALEWDLRIVNPALQDSSDTRANIVSFASNMARDIGGQAIDTIENNITQVEDTQLYVGQPILYYGAEFNGLFSAQVVPNDEQVSTELGKKIFAYADFVMEQKRAKPIMKLSVETMGEQFVANQRAMIESSPELWHKLYDISTIGHEFGHILWIDSDTESRMNGSGAFKNIEEFKATSGGLMAFFSSDHSNKELRNHIVDDLVSRAVGLMAWREVGEVLPYYCEGLIHLDILFGSGIISYSGKIEIDYSRYPQMRESYIEAYSRLAKSYLAKEDASIYLSRYATKIGDIYLPTDEKIREFVEHYYSRYQEIGQQTVSLSS